MLFGYARASNDDPHNQIQKSVILENGVEERFIYEDTAIGNKDHRPELRKCFQMLESGDVLVILGLDRLARSVKELTVFLNSMSDQGIGLHSVRDKFDTTKGNSQDLVFAVNAVNDMMQYHTHDRTAKGLRAAQKKGKFGGAPRKATDEKIRIAIALKKEKFTHNEVCETLGMSSSTLHRNIKEYKERGRK